MNSQAILGCLLGTAVGDALGLPAEGLSPKSQQQLFGRIKSHRLLFGYGMISDDTEHAFLTALAWVSAQSDTKLFAVALSHHLKRWILLLPPGAGLATARACWRLWFGVPPQLSGVNSAGNGAAMRAVILGVLSKDQAQLTEYVIQSSTITHTDPRAIWGAWLIALTAQRLIEGDLTLPDLLTEAKKHLPESANSLLESLEMVQQSLMADESTQDFASRYCGTRGVTGYVMHTVPICLHVIFSQTNDFQKAMLTILECGGDTDSNAALVGGVLGARLGQEAIPVSWINGLLEGRVWSQQVLVALQNNRVAYPFWLWQLLRNLVLLLIVLAHGFWRLSRGALK